MLNNLTILDLETTGLNPEWDFVTEIGAVRVRNGQVSGHFTTLVNFGGIIPDNITELTGITQADIDAGKDPVKAFGILRAFIGDSVIVAHNAAFDVAFLNRSYNRYGSEGLVLTNDWLCTKRLAQEVLTDKPVQLDGFGLGHLCRYFAVDNQSHHRALADAYACNGLLREMFAVLENWKPGSQEGVCRPLLNRHSRQQHTAYWPWVPKKGKEADNG